MNVSSNKLKISEHFWGSYFYKQLQKYGNMYMWKPNILRVPWGDR